MASLEKAERFGGVGLLGVPTFDFFVWVLDNYARGELLMNLREQLPPWLLNPAFVFLCMCGGLGLLYLSHQQQLRRILTRASTLVDVEQYRNKERPGWLLPLLWVALGALIATPVLALAYSLAYKGSTPSPLQAHSIPPTICKTADCFPLPKPKTKTSPSIITSLNCPNGVCAGHDVNGPVTVNTPVNQNAGVTTYDCAGVQKWVGQTPGSLNTINMNDEEVKLGTAKKMADLTNSRNYQELITLCTGKIKSAPEWLTPYLFCALGYLETGDIDKSKQMLSHYEDNKGPAYEGDHFCKQVIDYLRAKVTLP
jgi:hypothetical protein